MVCLKPDWVGRGVRPASRFLLGALVAATVALASAVPRPALALDEIVKKQTFVCPATQRWVARRCGT